VQSGFKQYALRSLATLQNLVGGVNEIEINPHHVVEVTSKDSDAPM